ncbi:hypothetical protein SEA_DOTI_13 [Microbacterium phage DoTi]|nr:hypothetical protein SEA_DOTI_13 [Microbacterium phage DoTi]
MRIRLTYHDQDGSLVTSEYTLKDFMEWLETWPDYVAPTSFHAERLP